MFLPQICNQYVLSHVSLYLWSAGLIIPVNTQVLLYFRALHLYKMLPDEIKLPLLAIIS